MLYNPEKHFIVGCAMRRVSLAIAACLASLPTAAFAQDVCSIAITAQAYDTEDYRTATNIMFAKKDDICNLTYNSLEEARQSAKNGGFNIGYKGLSIGASGAKQTAGGKVEISQTEFCRATQEDFSKAYSEQYQKQVASIALANWVECVRITNASSLFMDYSIHHSGQSFTGTVHRTANTGSFNSQITGISVVGSEKDSVVCNIGGKELTPRTVLETPYEITSTRTGVGCEKTGDGHASIAIQTSVDSLPFVHLPSKVEIEQDRLDQLKIEIDVLRRRMNEISQNAGVRFIAQGHKSSSESSVEWDIDLPEAGFLLVNTYTTNKREGSTRNAGVDTNIYVNGKLCSRDQSFEGESSNIIFYSSASCIMILDRRKHKIKAERRDHPNTTGNKKIEANFYVLKIQR